MQLVPITTASRRGLSKIVSQSSETQVALTRHGQVIAAICSANQVDLNTKLVRESAAVVDAAADLVSSRSNRFSLNETCARPGLGVDRVHARAAKIQTR